MNKPIYPQPEPKLNTSQQLENATYLDGNGTVITNRASYNYLKPLIDNLYDLATQPEGYITIAIDDLMVYLMRAAGINGLHQDQLAKLILSPYAYAIWLTKVCMPPDRSK